MTAKPVGNRPFPTRRKSKRVQDEDFAILAGAFQELFELLEDYAPLWYTERHHCRAPAASRASERGLHVSLAADSEDYPDSDT